MTPLHRRLFDAHFHIIDGRFPLVANQGYLPPAFTCEAYLERMSDGRLAGGAIVSGSFHAYDQGYLLDALKRLGERFVGVTQLPASVSDRQLFALDAAGVRAVRFNLKRGGSEDSAHLDRLARRVFELVGWHVELYVDARDLDALYATLSVLPAVSIDHLGLSREGLATLLALAERGVRVKATGFGRVDFDVKAALRDLYAASPAALMFGTDLPSTHAPRPYADADVDLIGEALGADAAHQVLYQNAVDFYRPRTAANHPGDTP
ncbi:amidohydrolase family protein [Zoogloea sp.]|uniref:amidohydrolase family protein n=1 Tax=Zoogloea sp. TaxID=49181 RepID=UPI0035B49DC0